jgi:hypothetical protein
MTLAAVLRLSQATHVCAGRALCHRHLGADAADLVLGACPGGGPAATGEEYVQSRLQTSAQVGTSSPAAWGTGVAGELHSTHSVGMEDLSCAYLGTGGLAVHCCTTVPFDWHSDLYGPQPLIPGMSVHRVASRTMGVQ